MNEQNQSQPSPSIAAAGPMRYDNIFDAIKFDSPSEVKRLMEAKADLTYKYEVGEEEQVSALEYAAILGRDFIVDMILKKRKIPDELNMALHRAAAFGRAKIVQSLLEARANYSTADSWSKSPLHAAADAGHASVVQILIGAKASFVDEDNGSWTPLHSAAFHGHKDVVNTLLEAKGDLDLEANIGPERDEGTPLFLAADKDHADVVKSLLVAKASLRSPDRLMKNLGRKGHTSVLRVLLANDLDVNFSIVYYGTILHTALETEGHVSFVRALIEAGASLNARDRDGRVPLHLAAKLGHTEIIEMLLTGGADIEARDSREYTPLVCAVNSCRDDAVQLLIRSRAKIDFSHSESGDTILHSALEKRPIEFLTQEEELVEAKRIESDRIKVIKTLLKAKATSLIQAPNRKGQTPLSLALAQKEDPIISLFQVELNKLCKIALLTAMHQVKGRLSFWNQVTASLREPQVFRKPFNFGFVKPPALNRPAIEEEAQIPPRQSPR